jgi:transcription termination factor Rho
MPSTTTASGVLEIVSRGSGYLRDSARSYQTDDHDVFVPAPLVQRFGLITGAFVAGPVQPSRQGPQLADVESVCSLAPKAFRERTPFAKLVATNPDRRFQLCDSGNVSMRIIDLFAPVGRGTRALIAAAPKTGKTQLLEDFTRAIRADAPEARIVVLLVDERPEEVTHFRRQVDAEVLASSSDQGPMEHARLANLCMSQVKCELECGRDVVVLIDSLTRLGRAFNARGSDSGRTMSGGLDSRALELPRQFFGMARNIEGGGSVTILATALIDTGSRMDDMIFEEFKGTGNCEIVLDRALADQRVFPALDLAKTGTRRDDLLRSEAELKAINALRRQVLSVAPKQGILDLRKALETFPTNEAMLKALMK